MFRAIFIIVLCVLCNPANAIQWIKGKVTGIEVTYMPQAVVFSLDTGNTACPAGKQLRWENASAENNKAVHSTVLAAMLAGKKLNVVINDNDSTCVIRYIYILNE